MWMSNSNWRRQDFQWHDDPAAGAPFDSNSSGDVMPACRYTVLQNHPELPWIASIWTMDEWNVPHCWRWPISGIWTFGLPLLLMPLKGKGLWWLWMSVLSRNTLQIMLKRGSTCESTRNIPSRTIIFLFASLDHIICLLIMLSFHFTGRLLFLNI